MNRRRFIGSVTSLGICTTAGCVLSEGDEYATIQDIFFTNRHDDPLTVELSIKRENTDEISHSEEREIMPESDWYPDCFWPDEPIAVIIDHIDGDDQTSYNTSGEDGCLSLACDVREERISLFVHNSTDCPISSPRCHSDNEEE